MDSDVRVFRNSQSEVFHKKDALKNFEKFIGKRTYSGEFTPYSFSAQCSLLIPLKTSENQKVSDVFSWAKQDFWKEKGKVSYTLCV